MPVGVNVTFEDLVIRVSENETREVCVVPIQKDFTRTIPIQISYMQGTAIGKDRAQLAIKYSTNFCF